MLGWLVCRLSYLVSEHKLSSKPVFVVGVFRSGTSLLCSILNQNPSLAVMYECDVWNFPRPFLNVRFRSNWAERMEFYNQALSRHEIVTEPDVARMKEIRTPLDLYEAYGKRKGATVSGEKSPFYCDRLVQLHELYPDAHFIVIWRPPEEIYRSVLKASEGSRFFARPGMLSRMIYHQEQAIRQAQLIKKAGARLLRLDYADLVDRTEKTCQDICAFLEVKFDERMLQLNTADLSAIYKEPHHAYLRRGIIERQKYDRELVPPPIVRKLERYRHHWEHLQSDWLPARANGTSQSPGAAEFFYHQLTGRMLSYYDLLVRAGFEFLPLTWLRVYRLLKFWVVNPPSGALDERTSLWKDFQAHRATILCAILLLELVVFVHLHANPHLMFVLFYAMPCALVALVVNVRWASAFVIASAVIAPIIQYDGDPDYRTPYVMVWNLISRFVLLEGFVLTLGRIRGDFKKPISL